MAVLLFDLNGTLLDPGAQTDAIREAVRLGMAHTLAGDGRPFAQLIEAAGGTVPEAMSPYPDVPDGLDRLRVEGHRLAVLTNSAQATAQHLLERAALHERFEAVIGADQAGVLKPARGAYRYALERLGDLAGESWLVASHDWDLIGARGAGLRTAFLDRGGPAPVTIDPDRRVSSLGELRM